MSNKKEVKLIKIKKILNTYSKAFIEDGLIDAEEQTQIKELQIQIKELEGKVEKNNNNSTAPNIKVATFFEGISKRLSEIEERFGIK